MDNKDLEPLNPVAFEGKTLRDLEVNSRADARSCQPNHTDESQSPMQQIVGQSQLMNELRTRIVRYAATNASVLILGETGTGKELVAKLLHQLSPRCAAPFIPVNCAAIPSSLAESEFFGSLRGAYTGASNCRHGFFAKANGGTLFLDEFGDVAPEIQAKLLRTLETGSYRPLGSNTESRANVRIVAATNRDLEQSVLRGNFRADLYYRINVLQIVVPPLRSRRGDIPDLVKAILAEFLPEGTNVRVTGSAMAQLLTAPWLGNVRELRNVLRRSLVLAADNVIRRLEGNLLPLESGQVTLKDSASTTQRLIDSLTRNNGCLEAIAQELRVSVRTVQRRIKDSGLRLRDFKRC